MKTPIEDYQQPKKTGGMQKVILNESETAETDELDPKFDQRSEKEELSREKQETAT